MLKLNRTQRLNITGMSSAYSFGIEDIITRHGCPVTWLILRANQCADYSIWGNTSNVGSISYVDHAILANGNA